MKPFALCLLAIAACNDSKPTTETPAQKGSKVYFANCVACHNADPKKDGVIGPAVHGSSKELVEARVLKATYPDGYKPKRETKLMVALPQLKDNIDDLTAFLNQ